MTMTKQELLNKCEVFLLDMDGTIYLGNEPIGDMKNTLNKLIEKGKRLIYFTNNSSKSHEEYVAKLKKMGFPCEGDCVYSSTDATAVFLNEKFKGKKTYVVGTEKTKEQFKNYGINVVEDGAEVCVLAYDTTITFEKIKKFNEYLAKGAIYVATHPDDVCPTEDVFMPDLGSFIKLFETSSHRLPDYICGKPYSIMAESFKTLYGVDLSKIAMCGDRLHTDIKFAVNAGITSVFVLSGEATLNDLKKYDFTPDIILDSLNDLQELL